MEIMEIREVEIRSVDNDERTVSGIAVPYNQTTVVNGMKERVEKGAFGSPENVTLFYGHDHRTGGLPIGKVVEARDTDDGLEIKAKFSDTAKANEVRSLVQDGVLTKFSIGFQPVKSRREGDVVVREQGDLKEVSIVAIPAYANAAVSEVRADNLTNTKENEMNENENTNAPEVAEIREAVSDLERKFAVLSEQGSPSSDSNGQYRHGGELLKGLFTGDSAAQTEVRAFTGAVTSDSVARPAWVNQALRLPLENRDFLNLWTKGALPASGNSVEYPALSGVTGTVTAQGGEGVDLPYMEIAVTTKSAPVLTYGGYSSLSRQVIERSDVAYLQTVLEFQARQYAKATNKAVRDAFTAATGTGAGTLVTGTAKGADWLSMVFNAAAAIEDNSMGSKAEFILMNRANFLKLVALSDTANRPVFDLNGDGSNTFGNLNVGNVAGSLAGLPIVVDSTLANASIYVAGSDAVKVFESAGAPFRLQDENIINLTKDFSLYGYLAVAVTNPLAVVKVAVS